MKNGKMMILYSFIIFVVAGVLGFNIVCSIDAFKVDFQVSSKSAISTSSTLQDELDDYLGENLVFFDEEKVTTIFDKYEYLELVSVQKSYPNSVSLLVKEKVEVYAVQTADGFAMLDVDGRVISVKEKNVNNVDNAPNTVITMSLMNNLGEITEDVEFLDLKVGDNICNFNEEYKQAISDMLYFCSKLEDGLDGLRSNIKSVQILKYSSVGIHEFNLSTTEGVSMEINLPSFFIEGVTEEQEKEYMTNISNNIIDFYVSLEDKDKLFGRIVAIVDLTETELFRIDYTPRESST